MGKLVTLGGDRLGSGKKQKVALHGFERSTHDLGYVWRNTQSPGTLVPFMVQLALPGDVFDINLGADVKTHPTVGPLFGSFKLQLDVFECPMRLYHSWLHNNKLKIGMDMSQVKIPLLEYPCNPINWNKTYINEMDLPPVDLQQINPSSLLAYLGFRGGSDGEYSSSNNFFNAFPFCSYWDIYKNYYSNKQEEVGYMVHINTPKKPYFGFIDINDSAYSGNSFNMYYSLPNDSESTLVVQFYTDEEEPPETVNVWYWQFAGSMRNIELTPAQVDVDDSDPISGGFQLTIGILCPTEIPNNSILFGISTAGPDSLNETINNIQLTAFDLENIDQFREDILSYTDYPTPFRIPTDCNYLPYKAYAQEFNHFISTGQRASIASQESLALKTYQSDIFNNWVSTEWIDGEAGINTITAVDTSSGEFKIDALNLARKVYDMLNRIAVSGGTYNDWLEAVYDHESFMRPEIPQYFGGLSKEIIFQEVVSTFGAEEANPLGTLAGKGGMATKHKGGQVTIKVHEPSFIIGIVSITPRIDYYQGNEFWTHFLTMDDLHKPNLDEIGFQDLTTNKMAWWDQFNDEGEMTIHSAGKQPAWIDYMTNYNRVYGNFANENSEMFMTLTRRYEYDDSPSTDYDANDPRIKDLTTYIDPSKFNYAFAQTDLSAMNFWVQIGIDMTARRKMSAKVMPNL